MWYCCRIQATDTFPHRFLQSREKSADAVRIGVFLSGGSCSFIAKPVKAVLLTSLALVRLYRLCYISIKIKRIGIEREKQTDMEEALS